jgi:TPR repeat protein
MINFWSTKMSPRFLLALGLFTSLTQLLWASPFQHQDERGESCSSQLKESGISSAHEGSLNLEQAFQRGTSYSHGRGVARDQERAAYYYELAAKEGHRDAQWHLAVLYEYGRGVEKDVNKAVSYYTMAANQGDWHAQNAVGRIYRAQGDIPRALEWYHKAKSYSFQKNHDCVRSFLKDGLTDDVKSALKTLHINYLDDIQDWIKSLCDDAKGQEVLFTFGTFYQSIDRHNHAFRIFEKLEQKQHVKAQFHVGLCYENGQGVPRNIDRAFDHYKLAADQGHAEAQYHVGLCYENGQGVSQDIQKGLDYYKKAANQGHAEAIKSSQINAMVQQWLQGPSVEDLLKIGGIIQTLPLPIEEEVLPHLLPQWRSEDLKPNVHNPLELAYHRAWPVEAVSDVILTHLYKFGDLEVYKKIEIFKNLFDYGLASNERTTLDTGIWRISMDVPKCLLWIPDHKAVKLFVTKRQHKGTDSWRHLLGSHISLEIIQSYF